MISANGTKIVASPKWFPRLMTREELNNSKPGEHLASKYHDLLEENKRLTELIKKQLISSLAGINS